MIEVVESSTFKRWIRGLRDRGAVARINARLRSLSLSHAGDVRAVGGGVHEMRVHHGPGYRVYFLRAARWCCAAATRIASNATSNAPGGWRGTGGNDERNVLPVGRRGTSADAGKTRGLYLEACAEEDPGDGSLIRAALNDIARSGNMSRLARETGMSREGLYKALSENGNPSFATVMRIARALGMQVRITA